MERAEFIARVRYLGWICYQMGANIPLHDMQADFEISKERLESLIQGTKEVLKHPEYTAEDNHNVWMEFKASQGYTYGDVLDVEAKKHPSMVPYSELSEVERRKDDMDLLMVKLAQNLCDLIENNKEE